MVFTAEVGRKVRFARAASASKPAAVRRSVAAAVSSVYAIRVPDPWASGFYFRSPAKACPPITRKSQKLSGPRTTIPRNPHGSAILALVAA